MNTAGLFHSALESSERHPQQGCEVADLFQLVLSESIKFFHPLAEDPSDNI